MIVYIGLSLSFIAIGILCYLNYQLKEELKGLKTALMILQEEFTGYQLYDKRFKEKDTAKREIRFDNVARSI